MSVHSSRHRLARAVFALALGASFPVAAQHDPSAAIKLDRIEVTGSNIRRTDIETALPVQVITREDIDRSGVTNTADLMGLVSANLIGATNATSIGSNDLAPGRATANLRGLGEGSTLVLINGRRSANYAFSGGAVDLNSIPLAVVDRVEILKDGASAIYGADAMAGVVNVILRKDFTGAEASYYGAGTQHGGGNHQQATASLGFGNLATDRYNVFATVDWQKDNALAATARPFSRTAYIPDEGVNRLSLNTFPANLLADNTLVNPTRALGCMPPGSIPYGPTSPRCGFDYASIIDILPPVEHLGVFVGGTWQVNADNQLFAQYLYARTSMSLRIAPTPASMQASNFGEPVLYPAGGPYYPTAFAAANGISGDLNLFYRTVLLGPRVDDVVTEAHLLIAGAQGNTHGWDYNLAFIYSRNDASDALASGYVSDSGLRAAMATGLINPFGPSGAEGAALLDGTQVHTQRHATGTTSSIEAKMSKDVAALPAGPLALAVGFEARRESLDDVLGKEFESGDIIGEGTDQYSRSASRNLGAIFAEFNVPIVKNLEAQLAVRYDHYSDFGSTVNPKVALRWQPVPELLLRSSWGTGFRPPTLYDLYTPLSHTFTDTISDPLRCPVTGLPTDCDVNFRFYYGGNPSLQPEKSNQFNVGAIFAPVPAFSLEVDYWKIDKTATIGSLDPSTILGDTDRFAANIIRGPVDPAYPGVPGPIDHVLGWQQNLGGLKTSGVDVDMRLRTQVTAYGKLDFAISGTYIIDWQQQLDGVNWISGVGRIVPSFAVGAVPRWRHYATLNWTLGPWGATLAQNFSGSYIDVYPNPAGDPRSVGAYELWNLQGTYSGLRNVTLTAGIKNLFDRAPPFSNQDGWMQTGYNPLYSDPLGRVFYASVRYAFK